MVVLLHFILALFLFLITNWFGKKSVDYGYYEFSFYEQEYNTVFDLLYKSFSPVVFIFIASLLFHKLGFDSCIIDIYYVVVYSFLIRVTYIIVMGRHSITDWKTIFLISVVSTSISYVVYNEFLLTKEFLIPSKEDIATALWFGFIGYIYKTLNTISNNGDSYEREQKYILKMKSDFSYRFDYVVKELTSSEKETNLIYSIMIYENFNRGLVIRFLERVLFFTRCIKTTGVMQVNSPSKLSDIDSIRIGGNILILKYREILSSEKNEYNAIRESIKNYNPDIRYINNVMEIYNILDEDPTN